MTSSDGSPADFEVTVQSRDAERAVVAVVGEVDLSTSPAFRYQLEAVLAGEVRDLTLDFSGVTFIDSTGLGVLVTAHRIASDRGGSIRLLGASRATRKVLEISGLTRIITIEDDPPSSTDDVL